MWSLSHFARHKTSSFLPSLPTPAFRHGGRQFFCLSVLSFLVLCFTFPVFRYFPAFCFNAVPTFLRVLYPLIVRAVLPLVLPIPVFAVLYSLPFFPLYRLSVSSLFPLQLTVLLLPVLRRPVLRFLPLITLFLYFLVV